MNLIRNLILLSKIAVILEKKTHEKFYDLDVLLALNASLLLHQL